MYNEYICIYIYTHTHTRRRTFPTTEKGILGRKEKRGWIRVATDRTEERGTDDDCCNEYYENDNHWLKTWAASLREGGREGEGDPSSLVESEGGWGGRNKDGGIVFSFSSRIESSNDERSLRVV